MLATRAERMASEEAFELEGIGHRGPLLPMMLAVPVSAGATPTAALRWIDLLLASLIAPLGCALAGRLGLGRRAAWVTGLLLVFHPVLVAGAGGAASGTAGLATVLLLTAWMGCLSPKTGRRRAAFVVGALVAWADPLSAVYVPALFAAQVVREDSVRARFVLAAYALLVLILSPVPAGQATPVGEAVLSVLVLWLPAATLLVLAPFVGSGLARLWSIGGEDAFVVRAWMVATAAHLVLLVVLGSAPGFVFGWGGLEAGTLLVPLTVLAGVAGLLRARPSLRPRLGRVALGLGMAASIFLVLGPLQTWFLPGAPATAGRLSRLARAMEDASAATTPGGWVALDLGPRLGPYEEARLADLARDHNVGSLPRLGGGSDSVRVRVLEEVPLESIPAGGRIGVLTRYRPAVLDVATLGGRGIFLQEPVARIGPWLVLRVVRPE